jgi:hypothetical protein
MVIADQTHTLSDGGNALWGNNSSEAGECYYDNFNQSFADNTPAVSCN